MSKIPEDLLYTTEHEWVQVEGDECVVGITDYAQGELGDIVFVELPEPGESLTGRLGRMRNWVDGPHFPDAARVEVRSTVSDEARANLTGEQVAFLSALGESLKDCEWTDKAIGDCIRSVAADAGIAGREAYVALYWTVLGKNHGPKASSLMAEMECERLLSLIIES